MVEKVKKLVEFVRVSWYFVVYIGVGISIFAGILDFRGLKGINVVYVIIFNFSEIRYDRKFFIDLKRKCYRFLVIINVIEINYCFIWFLKEFEF